MAGFCVVLSGRLTGEGDDASVWAPVIAAFKFDEVSFSQRVLAALPLIIRQNLDDVAAERLVRKLVDGGIDASVEQDDPQLAYFERAGTLRGPVPFSALEKFIHAKERYRLRGEQKWSVWEGGIDLAEDLFSIPSEQQSNASVEGEIPPPLFQASEPLPAYSALTSIPVVPSSLSEEDLPPPLPSSNEDLPPPLPSSEEQPPPFFASEERVAMVEEAPPPFMGRYSEPETGPTLEPDRPYSATRSTAMNSSSGALWWITGLVSLLAIIGLGTWFYLHRTDTTRSAPVATSSPQPSKAQTTSVVAPAVRLPSSEISSNGAARSSTATMQMPSTGANGADALAADNCAADAPHAQTPEEVSLLANSQRHLTGHSVRAGSNGEIYVVEAALDYDGMCRPSPYQIYVFNRGKEVGTLSPEAMVARTDGAITGFRLIDSGHLQIDIDHYTPNDPLCCASGHEQRIVPLSEFDQRSSVVSTSAASLPLAISQSDSNGSSNRTTTNHPSFDCKNAASPVEVTICADSELSALDSLMAQTYRDAMKRSSTENAQVLKDTQRGWLRERAQQCESDKECIDRMLQARVQALKQIPQTLQAIGNTSLSQLEQGQLDAARACLKNSNFDCSIQITQALLAKYPDNADLIDLLKQSKEGQSAALHSNWNVH